MALTDEHGAEVAHPPEVHQALLDKVAAGVAKLTVGAPEDNANITPVISETSANFICRVADHGNHFVPLHHV